MKCRVFTAGVMTSIFGGLLLANSNIHPGHKFAWGENIGWANWRDADGGAEGVSILDSYLSGYIWGENVGWLNVGDGTPSNGIFYSNADSGDFGVNIIDEEGNLEGFAWGENVGWINFDTSSLGNQRARFDRCTGRLRGYAWAENMGWINLEDDEHFVATLPRSDFDADGDVDLEDFGSFAACYNGSARPPAGTCPPGVDADFDCDGDVDLDDFGIFAANYTGAM